MKRRIGSGSAAPVLMAAVALALVACDGDSRGDSVAVRGRLTLPRGPVVQVRPGGKAAAPGLKTLAGLPTISGWYIVSEDGAFGWRDLVAGKLSLHVRIDGVEPQTLSIPDVDVTAGSDDPPPQWNPIGIAERLSTYRMRVLDSHRRPISGASVMLEPVRNSGFRRTTDDDGNVTVYGVDPEPNVGVYLQSRNGSRGSRPKIVPLRSEFTEIVLEDRIPISVVVRETIRLRPGLRLFVLVCSVDPKSAPIQGPGPNTEVNALPQEHSWTGFISNGEWIDGPGRAELGLPWPGHYALVLYVADVEDELFRIRVHPRWIKFIVEDKTDQVVELSVAQDQVDAAMKEIDEAIKQAAAVERK